MALRKTAGFQKPMRRKSRQVRVAMMSTEGDWMICSCGWAFSAKRKKIREDAAQRHLDNKHGGAGLWM